MLIKSNNNRQRSEISADACEAWLKRNPHRKAEAMTGKLVPDSVICKIRRSTDHACAKPHPETQMVRKPRDSKLKFIKKGNNHVKK